MCADLYQEARTLLPQIRDEQDQTRQLELFRDLLLLFVKIYNQELPTKIESGDLPTDTKPLAGEAPRLHLRHLALLKHALEGRPWFLEDWLTPRVGYNPHIVHVFFASSPELPANRSFSKERRQKPRSKPKKAENKERKKRALIVALLKDLVIRRP